MLNKKKVKRKEKKQERKDENRKKNRKVMGKSEVQRETEKGDDNKRHMQEQKKNFFLPLLGKKKKEKKNWRGKSPVGRTKKDEKKIRNFRDLKSKKRKWRRRLSNEN